MKTFKERNVQYVACVFQNTSKVRKNFQIKFVQHIDKSSYNKRQYFAIRMNDNEAAIAFELPKSFRLPSNIHHLIRKLSMRALPNTCDLTMMHCA